jgi:hypothetical protein
MSIRIVDEPEIVLTSEQHRKYMDEYSKFMSGYAGTMTFEQFVRRQIQEKNPVGSELK